jgi:hypothetical protein
MKLTRSYILKPYPNFHKFEDLRYSASRYKLFLQHFVTQLYYHPFIRFYSTEGMGTLANRAQKEAVGIVRSALATNGDCPQIAFDSCPATITVAKDTTFDYWVVVNSQWQNTVKIPAKSHRKLNDKLMSGWELSKHCEFFRFKSGNWYLRVFVTKKVDKSNPESGFLGVDVGIKHGVARSDKYLGKNIGKIIQEERLKQAERQRQGHTKKPFKTTVKQHLDREVNSALARCKANGWSLSVEHPKVLSNLKIDKWARSYFANRATQRADEEGVYIQWVNPSKTSITCSICGLIDKRSRANQRTFKCVGCGNTVNADINAAINIARKGRERAFKLDKAPEKITSKALI